ncbi:hypothetical protein BAN20980_04132 [Burkholderia anthina]|uniref:Uncharacterized protein n=1 Tax=Burkholderia anthina TaxID=179879 RepID=A0A6P2GCC8_9BURK|nr:hypothetical protein BAN20980_04132 [Burkholderia anthina]
MWNFGKTSNRIIFFFEINYLSNPRLIGNRSHLEQNP